MLTYRKVISTVAFFSFYCCHPTPHNSLKKIVPISYKYIDGYDTFNFTPTHESPALLALKERSLKSIKKYNADDATKSLFFTILVGAVSHSLVWGLIKIHIYMTSRFS